MISQKNVIRLSIGFGVASWISLLIIDLVVLFSALNNIQIGITHELPALLLNAFFVFLFVYYKYRIGKSESINFTEMLWRVFVTGLLTTIVSLIIKFFFFILGNSKLAENALVINFFYHVHLGLIAAFLVSTFVVWKRLILYQKSKQLHFAWQVFEYALLGSILFNFLGYSLFDTAFNIVFSILFAMGVILSVNLKWVAYLNFKQKWKSILLMVFVILYLWYFLTSLVTFSQNYMLVTDLLNNVFILSLFAFIFLYSIFSLLVILFNLPTSSVFEQKLEEVINFQRLSQSIQTEHNEEQVYDILLESSVSAVFADAAWLEITKDKDGNSFMMTSNIMKKETEEIKMWIEKSKSKRKLETGLEKILSSGKKFLVALKGSPFRSALILPLHVQQQQIGTLVLLKEVGDGFNKEMIDIISTFVNQACISIENCRLLTEALENERYKEELKIAKRVQRSLLPQYLDSNEGFKISAFSEAASEVGGDYYDLYKINDHKFALIIGDVSGKGTSAAFNMSQMKGVFHSLAQLDLQPVDFLVYANNALSRCLEKTSFITASYFIIDLERKEVEFARAGHCPSLYYDSKESTSKYFSNKGLGLGILRNASFTKYIQTNRFQYHSGDILVLFTDGIIEARNKENEEFGYERLQQFLQVHAGKDPALVQQLLIKELHQYCQSAIISDDYTLVIIKFS
jgi:phosphoserine phosphatase RsbU/P